MALMNKKGSYSKVNNMIVLPVLVEDLALLLVWLEPLARMSFTSLGR
jgi:hypothetical protein